MLAVSMNWWMMKKRKWANESSLRTWNVLAFYAETGTVAFMAERESESAKDAMT
jgi:hypothetical protein